MGAGERGSIARPGAHRDLPRDRAGPHQLWPRPGGLRRPCRGHGGLRQSPGAGPPGNQSARMEKAARALKPEPRDASDLPGLVAAGRTGDPAALAALYRQFAGVAMAVAYRLLLSRADAEDV